jgi:Tfp pilus assembly protein PilV
MIKIIPKQNIKMIIISPRLLSCEKNRTKKGFGLLEVLISAVIIIMILAALVFIGRASLKNNEYLSQRAQAIYLAQEGIEMTRQIRDTNWTDGDNATQWNTLAYTLNPPFLITTANTLYSLKYDANLRRWHLITPPVKESISFPATPPNITYDRSIKAEPAISPYIPYDPLTSNDLKPYAIKVTSTVTWSSSGQNYTITLSEMMTNWRPDF